ncbi:hypothetical protein N0V88_001273 [Collariella sp. IMI 366227]|nr:hypothetical protein N0V88_001273 [Collariella sp. IMI 366227]
MNQTKWATKPSAGFSTSEARIDSAVCQPNLRWDGQTPCLLQQVNGSELRAFTDDGNPAEPYDWLKIAGKVKSLSYHPDSDIIKIAQAMDQSSSVPVGSSMVVKFCSNADASWVAEWAQKHPAIRVIQEQDSSQTPSHTPVRAQMRVSEQQTPSLLQPEPYNDVAASTARSLRTRQVGQLRNVATPVTRRWSEEHNNWLKDWKMPLVLNRATVSKEDIPRLDEGECLNDNLIGYGLRYLFDKLGSRHPDLHKRVYLHNSFFYEKLKAGRGAINYDGVKSWTAKVDLLSYDYIVVPVNEHYHWWVAIICNPGKLDPNARSVSNKVDKESDQAEGKIDETSADVEMTDQTEKQALQSPRTSAVDELELVKSDLVDLVSDDRVVSIDLASGFKPKKDKKPKPKGRTYSTEDPRIITLDSMGGNHPQAISHLKKYLLAEFEHKRNRIIPDSAQPLGMKAVNLPEQSNLHDCGIYLLGYIMEFVKDPSQFIQTLLRKERPDWNFDASDLRGLWRDTIFNEHAMYQKQHQPAKQSRRGSSSANNTPNRSAQPSRQASRETSAVAHRPNGLGGERLGSTELSKTMATPLNFEARHLHGSSPRTPQPNGDTLPRSPATASGWSSQQTRPPQNQGDDVTILPPEEERPEAVIPSIETQEIEELPGPPGKWSSDEPKFIAKLASSAPSESSEASDDYATELSPKHFYTPSSVPRLNNSSYHHSNGNSGRNMRATMSSPASNVSHRTKTAMTRPVQSPTRTASPFVVAGSSPSRGGSDDAPVVQKAELVRQSEAIDLT